MTDIGPEFETEILPALEEGGEDDAAQHALAIRVLEAVLFTAVEPLTLAAIAQRLPAGSNAAALIAELETALSHRGVNLVRVAGRYALRTAPDLASYLQVERTVTRKLSRAAIETLSIIAYHQPITRAEIEEIRGVALSRGTVDSLLETGWIKPKGHRNTPGRPATWVTTQVFLDHFGLDRLDDLPGVEELKAAGLLDPRPAIAILRQEDSLLPPEEGPAAEDEEEEGEALEPAVMDAPGPMAIAEAEVEAEAEAEAEAGAEAEAEAPSEPPPATA